MCEYLIPFWVISSSLPEMLSQKDWLKEDIIKREKTFAAELLDFFKMNSITTHADDTGLLVQ